MNKKTTITLCIAFIILLITIIINKPSPIASLHINSETVRLESDMSKKLSITVQPENAYHFQYKLVSEDNFVAVCKGNTVYAANEGETFVYAESLTGKIRSNKIKVIVTNDIFEVAAKIILLSEEKQVEDELKEIEITAKKASQITQTDITSIPEKFVSPIVTEENADEIVYVTKSGSKFHLSTCNYAKNASAISLSEAVSAGKTPCKVCNP